MLREIFPLGRFAAPATREAISSAEAALGVRFPAQLTALYLECDGFREDRGNAKYLLSLTEEDFIGSLISLTRFHWEEIGEFWPQLDLRPYIFFGSSSGGEAWGINWRQPDQIIAFHHHMEGDYEIVGASIVEVYKADYARYAL